MKQHPLIQAWLEHPLTREVNSVFAGNDAAVVKGLAGSSPAFLLSALQAGMQVPVLCVFPDRESAAYFYSDLSGLNSGGVYFFPSSYRRKLSEFETETGYMVERAEVLGMLSRSSPEAIIVTHVTAFSEKVISPAEVVQQSLTLHKGEKISPAFLEEVLFEYQFEYTDFISRPGQFSRRGSIVDIFSFSGGEPLRIDFFGDEIESIRHFDITSQLSTEMLEEAPVTPDFKTTCPALVESHFLSFFKTPPLVYLHDSEFFAKSIEEFSSLPRSSRTMYGESSEEQKEVLFSWEQSLGTMKDCRKLYSGISSGDGMPTITFRTSPQPSFSKKYDMLAEDLSAKKEAGNGIFLFAENHIQASRLNSIMSDLGHKQLFVHIPVSLHEGFYEETLKMCFYSDHQIFERFHRYKVRERNEGAAGITLNEFLTLNPGDYVVHMDHGIGIFGGMEKVEISGREYEQIRIVYRDNDVLYVNINNLHKISRYKSGEATAPRLSKLGTGAWQQMKLRAKGKVKDIARDLILLYSQRMQQKGYAFSPDTYLQQELEASFIFEDTPDQEKATRDVKQDMEKSVPMDRLICGDVGFGKTEIAIRAAFKSVTDSRQVAVLVPTTILALQHYYTFLERLRNFPCNIEHLSRLKTPAQQKDIIKRIQDGSVDIVIGTHKLLGKEICFKDLGLLIIDEEQKFGVAAKEKLRALRVNVDTLTLTATPIPRTLQFSLMGARDLSMLTTPPPNRQPVVTEVHRYDPLIIKMAIDNELERGGQVFFVHNKVKNIEKFRVVIEKLCPVARVTVAHGQMKPAEMEDVLLNFIDGSFDVLIATTIIENGLDIPNANTIIINDAQNFGLSDLHQLRGRVGRSNRRAYCYLLAPDFSLLTKEARQRLKAIEVFSELGSGFNIAMQDLDIRGAGNLLGAEQSGFIAEMGFETYRRILKEAVEELKETEFKELFENTETELKVHPEEQLFSPDCSIETDLELMIPETYISNITERLKIYRQISECNNAEKTDVLQKQLKDRFGKIPEQTLPLFEIGPLRQLARQNGMERLLLKNGKMTATFITEREHAFYQSNRFSRILNWIMVKKKGVTLKDTGGKLQITVDHIKTINEATDLLLDMMVEM
jgi:transcription-repair coupling factor (superfamily II helicase)